MNQIRTEKLSIIVVGASGSGKTSLIRQARQKEFKEIQRSTPILKHHKNVFTPQDEDGQQYEVEIFDFSSRQGLRQFSKIANVAVICFDLNNSDALNETVCYLKALKDYKFDIILVGTKSDKIIKYSRRELDEFINDINGRQVSIEITSSRDRTGIDYLFEQAIQKAITNYKAPKANPSVNLKNYEKNKSWLSDDDDDETEDISQDLRRIEQNSKQSNNDSRVIKKNSKVLLKQLWDQLNSLQENEFHGVFYYPIELDHWIAYINGPFASPYEKGCFQIDLTFPEDYPFKPPIVRFDTLIYHPNISQEDGILSTGFLMDQWSATINVRVLLLMIQALLDNDHQDQYSAQALVWTEDYAMPRKDESNLEELKQQFIKAFEPFSNLQIH